jgi:hypothetical protein
VAHGVAQLLEVPVEAAFLQFGDGRHGPAQSETRICRL